MIDAMSTRVHSPQSHVSHLSLHEAVQQNQGADVIGDLIKSGGADVNLKDHDGITALVHALRVRYNL